jgi:excisionase family DNA binding protein
VPRDLADAATAAAQLGGLNPETLRRWAREGRVPYYRVGRRVCFDIDELRDVFRVGSAHPERLRVEPDFEAV